MERKQQVIHNLPAPRRWWHVVTHHVQGMHFVHDGLVAISRNGRPTGEVLFASCPGERWLWNTDRIECDESHVGGIDGYDNILAVPSYDHTDPVGGFLTLYRLEDDFWTQIFRTRVMYRPYAVGITCFGSYDILAVVACARGSAVHWYSLHRMSQKFFMFDEVSRFARGARNNIVLTSDDRSGIFYELRAGFRYDTVKKYRVDFARHRPTRLPLEAVARAKNGLCGVRWGATMDCESGEEILHTTARNAFAGRLCTTAQRLRWESTRD